MLNHLKHLLNKWYPQRDTMQWVLATIIATKGSSYRKPGAMMMINNLGQYHGMLSGGCLESDIMRQARRCWDSGLSKIIQYDMRDEDDIAWQLGIGCGGMVRILLQAVSSDNDYQQLCKLRNNINRHQDCYYNQILKEGCTTNSISFDLKNSKNEAACLSHKILAPVHLAVFGGGADAVPLVRLAASIGWQVSLYDPRTTYARASDFVSADLIVKESLATLNYREYLQNIDAAVIMTHNLELDAKALQLVQKSSATYTGLLGPEHRSDRVFSIAKLKKHQLDKPLANPIGLRLGGDLPESIALSIIAEIHAYLHKSDANSMGDILFSQNLVKNTA